MAVLKVYKSALWKDVALSSHAATHTDGSDDVQSATASQKGLATAAQITKLDGIEALADVTDATNVNAAGALMNSDADAKGDIFAATADNAVSRLAVGTNDFVLTAASGEATGVKWAAAAGGVTGPGSSTDNAIARFNGTGGGTIQNSGVIIDDSNFVSGIAKLTVDDVRIDGKLIECPTAADDLTVRGGSTAQLLLGRDGDFDIFAGTKHRFGPAQALKATLGSVTLPFAEAFIHGLLDASVVGVRGPYVVDTFSSPPTDAQLDAAFGQPAALGSGFHGIIENTTGAAEYIRTVITDGTFWYFGADVRGNKAV